MGHNIFVLQLRVDEILIRGLKWSKLLDDTKKGQWWLSGDMATLAENVEEVSAKIDKEAAETKKMLQLAAAQRMNTDARRAIFCVIMSGEDYIDAFEKLLRLELTGKQVSSLSVILIVICSFNFQRLMTVYHFLYLCLGSRNHAGTFGVLSTGESIQQVLLYSCR